MTLSEISQILGLIQLTQIKTQQQVHLKLNLVQIERTNKGGLRV